MRARSFETEVPEDDSEVGNFKLILACASSPVPVFIYGVKCK
jgi:hypothetical protein